MKKLPIYLLLVVFLVALTGTFSLASSEKELVVVVDPAAKGVTVLNPLEIKNGEHLLLTLSTRVWLR